MFITLYSKQGCGGFSTEDRLKKLFETAMLASRFTLIYKLDHNTSDADGDLDVYHPLHRHDNAHIHLIFPEFSETAGIIELFKNFLAQYNLSSDHAKDVILLDTFVDNLTLYSKGVPTAVSPKATVLQLTTKLYEGVLEQLSSPIFAAGITPEQKAASMILYQQRL